MCNSYVGDSFFYNGNWDSILSPMLVYYLGKNISLFVIKLEPKLGMFGEGKEGGGGDRK